MAHATRSVRGEARTREQQACLLGTLPASLRFEARVAWGLLARGSRPVPWRTLAVAGVLGIIVREGRDARLG